MKLFLASQDLGNFPQVLKDLVGEKKRALVIGNARDYYQDESRIEDSLKKTFVNLSNIGIDSKRLDLRKYFGAAEKLAEDIKTYDPDLIFSIGGNVFCLATALHESGMDKIIRDGVESNQFVYGGYSAGSMVAANNLGLYEVMRIPENQKPYMLSSRVMQIYNIKPHMIGLKLINQYILPHMDRSDHTDTMQKRLDRINQAGAEAILLNDSDVFVINGEDTKVLKPTENKK